MIIEERFSIQAPLQHVWDFFLDVPRSSACMPGVTDVEQVDERSYRGRVQVRLGPLKAGFTMMVDLEEVVERERIALAAKGSDRGTSSLVQARITANLTPEGPARTAVSYAMDVSVRGPLGRFGQTVMRDTARSMTEQFIECVERRLALSGSGGGGDA